jgi:hypothetical protein
MSCVLGSIDPFDGVPTQNWTGDVQINLIGVYGYTGPAFVRPDCLGASPLVTESSVVVPPPVIHTSSISGTSVPEPGSLLLLATALAVLCGRKAIARGSSAA